jgi:uncharacterized membrane protein YheB (UPF0754 family)
VLFVSAHIGIKELTIPVFTGVIGYITNWTGVLMLFAPLEYHGIRIPGLKTLAPFLPKKALLVPLGLGQGKFGWQGVIPSRAAKMGSVAVDKGLAKLGDVSEFYDMLEPDAIAEHLVTEMTGDIRELTERIMEREHPQLWRALPMPVKETIHGRVRSRLPEVAKGITAKLGQHIDNLFDVKVMVVRKFTENPKLANRIFHELGDKELQMIINFGFIFGFILGIPLMFITLVLPQWWIVPLVGIAIGYLTNKLALDAIFQPIEPRRVLGIKFHGLFLRRQDEVADVYSRNIADDIITIGNMGEELLHGPASDRSRRMIERELRVAVDSAVGPFRAAAYVAGASRQYVTIRESMATEAVALGQGPMSDPEFNKRQGAKIHKLLTDRIRTMEYEDFAEMLRSAIKDDEWVLILHGGVLGLFAGMVHVTLFNFLKILG